VHIYLGAKKQPFVVIKFRIWSAMVRDRHETLPRDG
jgi:hypothetical protein